MPSFPASIKYLSFLISPVHTYPRASPNSLCPVVWVANRENYLANNSGILTINDDGDLLIHDGGGKSIILTSVSAASANSSRATLLDSGNFVLRNEAGEVVWQSFDYPTHIMLPGMEIGVDKKAGFNRTLVSWKSPQDPAPGSYSFEADPEGPLLRFFIKRNGSIYWSTGNWNGAILSLVPEMKRSFPQRFSFVGNEEKRTITYALDEVASARAPWKFVLDPNGQLEQLDWLEDRQYWKILWAQPIDECDEYDACVPNARCNISALVRCNCLQGFSPADDGRLSGSSSSSSSSRCVRQANLTCGNGDRFYAVGNIKFPDQSIYAPGVPDCESWCRNNCSCTAYATAYRNGTGGCLFWSGDLIGLRDSPIYINGNGFAAGDLYIRVGGSHKGNKLASLPTYSVCDGGNNLVSGSTSSARKIGLIIGVVITTLSETSCDVTIFFATNEQLKLKPLETVTVEEALNLHSSTASDESYLSETSGADLPFFSFAAIEAATDNFAPSNKLGQGGFGPVYKGKLPEGEEIAVKRLSRRSGQGLVEFKNEVLLISKLQHRNLVRLLGWAVRGEEKIIIYEYMPNKSLDSILFGERSIIWVGYMSPEYAMGGVFSMKSDVFSFGVLLLEIVGGERNTHFRQFNGSLNLLGYAWELWKEGRSLELIDPILLVDSSPTSTTEILRYAQVALLCGQDSAEDRPTMSDVVHMLTDMTATIAEPKQPAFLLRRAADVDASSSLPTTCSLDAFIRKTGIFGIVNGMDIQEWNPWTDKYISVNYDAATVTEAKALLKENLQIQFGLPVDRSVPLIGFIDRLEEQKGSDILVAAISQFIEEDVQIVVFGTGKTKMEKHIEALEQTICWFPVGFEPCGLIQLHAMRYGTIPIVASTGGLVDTVKEGRTGFHVGAFNVDCEAVDPADTAVIASTVRRALSVYGTGAHREIVKNCMAQDLSWKGPAK
ncbi:hypothetical protein ACLOJK_039694 [Asimina triloba]